MKTGHAKHASSRKKRGRFSASTVLSIGICLVFLGASFFLWKTASFISSTGTETGTGESEDNFRPVVGDPPYRIAVDAGHGGSDPGASGVVLEKEMTAETAQDLFFWLEKDSNYIPLASRDSYDTTANPSERASVINAQVPDLLLSIHGNSAPEGSNASGFECYPVVPGRTWHRESLYFAKLLADGMQQAGEKLRGYGGVRYIYYIGEEKQLVESNHTEVREERSFTLLEDVSCPAVLAEQCFITSAEDIARFGSKEGCYRAARIYYEAICRYFGTEPVLE